MKLFAITGLSGVIGQRLLQLLPPDITVLDLYHTNPQATHAHIQSHTLDLSDPMQVSTFFATYKPDAFIHLAAITHIDRCEIEKGNTSGTIWKTNVEAPAYLCEAAASHGCHFVLMSTECVFKGDACPDETTPTHPINWYGRTKAEAEKRVTQIDASSAILRSVVAYHPNDDGKTLYGQILRSLEEGRSMQLVDDHFFTPTSTDDIIQALLSIALNKRQGIYHIAPRRSLSPYEFGMLIAHNHDLSTDLLSPCHGIDFFGVERNALRLVHSCLDATKTAQDLGMAAREVEDVIRASAL